MPNSYQEENLMLEPVIDNPENEIENDQEVLSLLQQMSLDEKLSQLSGDFPKFPIIIQMASIYNAKPYPAGVNRRLGNSWYPIDRRTAWNCGREINQFSRGNGTWCDMGPRVGRAGG